MSERAKLFFAMMIIVAVLTAANIGMGFFFMTRQTLEEIEGGVPAETMFSNSRATRAVPYSLNAAVIFLSLGAIIAIIVSGELVKHFNSSEERLAQLVETTKAAARISEARSRLIADMRHEMRKPLNSVVRLSRYMLGKEEMPEDARDDVEKIHNAGMTLLGVINDISDISKLKSRKFEIMPVEYDVPSLINDIVTLNFTHVGNKPIDFNLHIDRTMPSKFFGDELRVELVCNNLLENAFKYTREGKIDLFFDCERMGRDEWLTIRVADTGIGIAEDNIEGLFSGYGGVYPKHSARMEGSCLSVTRAIVKMMGGTITADSNYGKGSVFTVKIPQGVVTDTPIGDEVAENLQRFNHSAKQSAKAAKLVRVQLPYTRVLVVDDIQANLDIIEELLGLYGMKVDCLTSGRQAIQKICEESVFYDAIFMDHMMPDMNGVETVRVIREEIAGEYARNIPIIALTANATNGNEKQYLEKGFQAFLSKPIDIFQLDAVVLRWLHSKEAEKEHLAQHTADRPGNESLPLMNAPAGWVSANTY
jgi:signal transduction histidine kinase/CheY-like chemotaxis protein